MGDKKANREKFLALHPYCCFCGGDRPTTTEDHIPARSLFFRRGWPEGYVFPACDRCNSGSAEDELFMGFLVRISVTPVEEEKRNERRKAIAGIKARYPDFFQEFQKLSRVQTRRRAQAIGGLEQFGIDPTSIVMVLMPQKAMDVATRYGKKMGTALHYFHTGKALPVNGDTWAWVMTNAVSPALEIPQELMGPLASAPLAKVERGSKSLNDQFEYRYLILEDGAAACFLITLGGTMTVLVMTFRDRMDAPSLDQQDEAREFLNAAASPAPPSEP